MQNKCHKWVIKYKRIIIQFAGQQEFSPSSPFRSPRLPLRPTEHWQQLGHSKGVKPWRRRRQVGWETTYSNHFLGGGRSLKTGCRFTLKFTFFPSQKAHTSSHTSPTTLLSSRAQRGILTLALEAELLAWSHLQQSLLREGEEEPKITV